MRRDYRFLLFLFAILSFLSFISCNDKPTKPGGGGGGGSSSLLTPENPPDGAKNQRLAVQLNWNFVDTVNLFTSSTYDVYFGEHGALELIKSDLFTTGWLSPLLQQGRSYSWRIIARINDTTSDTSDTWTFSTANDGGSIREYPMDSGSTWSYQEFLFNVPDCASDSCSADTTYLSSSIGTISILGDTLLNVFGQSQQSLIFGRVTSDGFGPCNDTVYYQDNQSELVQLYSTGTCDIMFAPRVTPGASGISLSETTRDLLGAHSLLRSGNPEPDVPRVMFQFPLRLGDTWTMHEPAPFAGGLVIQKTVIGFETVTTPAGAFECAVVLWEYFLESGGDALDNLVVLDYISDEGLIERELILLEYTRTDPGGSIISRGTMVQTTELTTLHLPGS